MLNTLAFAPVDVTIDGDPVAVFTRSGFTRADGWADSTLCNRVADEVAADSAKVTNDPQQSGFHSLLTSDYIRAFRGARPASAMGEATRALVGDSRTVNLIRTITGAEPRLLFWTYFERPPGAPGSGMHQDIGYLPVSGTVFTWIPLNDPPAGHGLVYAADGRHFGVASQLEFKRPLRLTGVRQGDITCHRPDVDHKSEENVSGSPFTALVIATYPDGERMLQLSPAMTGNRYMLEVIEKTILIDVLPGEIALTGETPLLRDLAPQPQDSRPHALS